MKERKKERKKERSQLSNSEMLLKNGWGGDTSTRDFSVVSGIQKSTTSTFRLPLNQEWVQHEQIHGISSFFFYFFRFFFFFDVVLCEKNRFIMAFERKQTQTNSRKESTLRNEVGSLTTATLFGWRGTRRTAGLPLHRRWMRRFWNPHSEDA